jgi:hypothetical protein
MRKLGFTYQQNRAALQLAGGNFEGATALLYEHRDQIFDYLSMHDPTDPIYQRNEAARQISQRIFTLLPDAMATLKLFLESPPQKPPEEPKTPTPKSNVPGTPESTEKRNWLHLPKALGNTVSSAVKRSGSQSSIRQEPSTYEEQILNHNQFDLAYGPQLKVLFDVEVIQANLPTWLIPFTEGATAVHMRNKHNASLFTHVRLLLQAYPPGTSRESIIEDSMISKLCESSPELIFPRFDRQVQHAPPDLKTHFPPIQFASKRKQEEDVLGEMILTKHSNLTIANAVAHMIPPPAPHSLGATVEDRTAKDEFSAIGGTPSTEMEMKNQLLQQMRQVIIRVNHEGPMDLIIPATMPIMNAPALAPELQVKRYEMVAKSLKAALHERSNKLAMIAGLAHPALEVTKTRGGTVYIVCQPTEDWANCYSVFKRIMRSN